MVGVPGKSKGCGTCRSRKVRCDERHPYCQRCERGGFHCRGYDAGLNFLHRDENNRLRRKSPPPKARRTQVLTTEVGNPDNALMLKRNASDVTRINLKSASPDPRPLYDAQLVSSFMGIYLTQNSHDVSQRQWICDAVDMSRHSRVLHMVLGATAMTRLGWNSKDQGLSHAGHSLYNQCLGVLEQRLTSPVDPEDDALLAAFAVSEVYESFVLDRIPTPDRSVQAHAGLAAVLHRQSQSPMSTFARTIVAESHRKAVIACLMTWKPLPASLKASPNLPNTANSEVLVNLHCSLAAELVDLNAAIRPVVAGQSADQQYSSTWLISQFKCCLDLYIRFQQWARDFASYSSFQNLPPPGMGPEIPSRLLPTTMISIPRYHWALCIQILDLMMRILDTLQSTQIAAGSAAGLPVDGTFTSTPHTDYTMNIDYWRTESLEYAHCILNTATATMTKVCSLHQALHNTFSIMTALYACIKLLDTAGIATGMNLVHMLGNQKGLRYPRALVNLFSGSGDPEWAKKWGLYPYFGSKLASYSGN